MESTYEQAVPLSFEKIKTIYHRELGRRVSLALDAKARRGEWIGQAPTGYRNVGGRVEIDPVTGPLVAEAFRLAARKRSSLRQILDELTPKGLRSRNGKPMGPSALAALLQNPFYVGMIRYKGKLYEGEHEALVSPSLFDRAGRSLRRRRR